MVASADLEVIEVVRRRDLHGAGALLGVGVVVADDRDAAADQRQDRVLADQVPEPLVLGMHRDRGVAQHRLGPRGGDDDGLVGALDRIADVPEMSLHLDLLHLEVGDRGEQLRVPVDQPLVLVDQALVVEIDEDLQHRARQPLVHRETLARPVARGAEPLELVDDDAARFCLPGPHLLEELVAAYRTPVSFLALHHLALDHHLGRDAGVVGAGLPQHVAPAHALEAAQHVLQRIVERMPHVQGARHVRRRDHDAIGLGGAPFRAAGAERLRALPRGRDAGLDLGRLVAIVDHHRSRCSRARKPSGALRVNVALGAHSVGARPRSLTLAHPCSPSAHAWPEWGRGVTTWGARPQGRL